MNCLFVKWGVALGLAGVLVGAGAQELRTNAQNSSEPKFIGSSGKVTGLCVELHRALEKADPRLHIVGDQDLVPLKRAEKQLEMREVDMVCALSHRADRDALFHFSKLPVFVADDVLVVRQDDTVQVHNWDDVAKLGAQGTILSNAGRQQGEALKKDSRLNIDDGAQTTRQNLGKLLLQRGRFFLYRRPGINQEIKDAKLVGQVKVLPQVMSSSSAYMLIGKHLPAETVARINAALEKLQASGELKAINDRWKDY
jgi:polar amino acid transport system substrate-binding protein